MGPYCSVAPAKGRVPGIGTACSGACGLFIASAGVAAILGRLMEDATTIPMPDSTAPPRNAYPNPETSADVGAAGPPRVAVTVPTIVTATANPTGPPTWVEVLMRPDA